VIIPGTVNYFYNTNGRRLAEALADLGYSAELRTLGDSPIGDCDLCLICNISEVIHSYGNEPEAAARIRELGSSCRGIAAVSLDSVMTPWFRRALNLCEAVAVPTILDLGLWDQGPYLEPGMAGRYRFVRDGLTPSELRTLDAEVAEDGDRPIPWTFVGHCTAERAAFIDYLVGHVDASGFVYIPPLEPITESGTPHLNPQQFRAVLRRSRYHVWCSHHHYFYMEPERFRLPMLAGCVPMKVLIDGQEAPGDAPLTYLMVAREKLAEIVRSRCDRWLHSRLCEEYRRNPLASSLAGALEGLGLLGGRGGPPSWAAGCQDATAQSLSA
jgi:hypothetical protein